MAYSGSIVDLDGKVYFLPTSLDLPLLLWNVNERRFDCVDTTGAEGQGLLQSVTAVANNASTPLRVVRFEGQPAQAKSAYDAAERQGKSTTGLSDPKECGDQVVTCEALYGVLHLGAADSVLLFVRAVSPVASLRFQSNAAEHSIFLVKTLEWRVLPSAPVPARAANQDEEDNAGNDSLEKSSTDDDDDDDDGEGNDAAGAGQPHHLPQDTLKRYHDVIRQFCAYVNENDGAHSYLYFSPTLNLAQNPKDIIDQQLWGQPDAADVGSDTCETADRFPDDVFSDETPMDHHNGTPQMNPHADSALARRKPQTAGSVFQWNMALLAGFQPVALASRHLTSRRLSSGQEAMRRESDTIAPYFVPSFIRGLVHATRPTSPAAPCESNGSAMELLMITRLSARFAGTRYNRRGLENLWSGVCANMAMTAVWMTSHSTLTPRRIAVYEILRGSIPRRWKQKANLSFKPPIQLSSTSTAVRELRSHLDLLKRVFPQYDRYYFIDTTSTSKLEKPLSDSFENTAHRLQTRDDATTPSHESLTYADRFFYLKYNVKQKKKKMPYAAMRANLITVVDESLDDSRSVNTPMVGLPNDPWDDFLLYEETIDTQGVTTWSVLKEQVLLMRVNCLDNLDRTNLTQSMIVTTVLPKVIHALTRPSGTTASSAAADAAAAAQVHLQTASEKATLELFALQGVAISQLYAGTEPHFLNYMRGGKPDSVMDKASEGLLAIRRWYNNNFYDGRKQDAISLVTGQHNAVSYTADMEDPFFRDMSTMNRHVFRGVLIGFAALLLSFVSVLSSSGTGERRYHVVLLLFWCIYNLALIKRLAPYHESFTNRPLLAFAP